MPVWRPTWSFWQGHVLSLKQTNSATSVPATWIQEAAHMYHSVIGPWARLRIWSFSIVSQGKIRSVFSLRHVLINKMLGDQNAQHCLLQIIVESSSPSVWWSSQQSNTSFISWVCSFACLHNHQYIGMWAVHPCQKPWVEAIQWTSAAPRAKHLEVPQDPHFYGSSSHLWFLGSIDIPLGSWPWRLISGSESQAPSNLPRFTVRPSPEVGYSTRSLPDYQLHPNLWHVVGASNSKLVHSWPRPWPKQTWKTLSTPTRDTWQTCEEFGSEGVSGLTKTSQHIWSCKPLWKDTKTVNSQVWDARTNIETCITCVCTASIYHLLKDDNNSGASKIDPHAVLWTP